MTYPNPTRFVRYVADRSRCTLGEMASDTEIELALDWLRDQIIAERVRQDYRAEREDAHMAGDDNY